MKELQVILLSVKIQTEWKGEWITLGNHSIESFFNAGQVKKITFSGNGKKIPLSDCPKKYNIRCVPAVSVPGA